MPVMSGNTIIGGKLFTIYDYDSYSKNRDILRSDDQTAVEVTLNGKKVVLPVRNPNGNKNQPGIYSYDQYDSFKMPETEEEEKTYCPQEDTIFRFDNIGSMQELIDRREQFQMVTNQILETPDNITIPPLKENDTPAMRSLKEAIIHKNIDMDKYQERFGANYPNDKRKIGDTSLTLFILERFCGCLDLECDLVLRDAPGNIPNPMHKTITANLVPGGLDNIKVEDN